MWFHLSVAVPTCFVAEFRKAEILAGVGTQNKKFGLSPIDENMISRYAGFVKDIQVMAGQKKPLHLDYP